MYCLWSGVINFHSFPNGSFISLELHLLWTHRVFPVISWFLIILTCCFLGTSHFGRPPVFWKQFILDTALDISSNIFHFFKILVFQVFRKGVGEVMGGGGGVTVKGKKWPKITNFSLSHYISGTVDHTIKIFDILVNKQIFWEILRCVSPFSHVCDFFNIACFRVGKDIYLKTVIPVNTLKITTSNKSILFALNFPLLTFNVQ